MDCISLQISDSKIHLQFDNSPAPDSARGVGDALRGMKGRQFFA
jgi:hypothetical protein